MEFWWLPYGCLGNLLFWWVVLIVAVTASYPFVRLFRTWQATRRFIRSEGIKLENPQNAEARFQLANIYAERGSWRKAIGYAREAVRVAGENPLYEGKVPYHFLRLLGDALYHRGLRLEAADVYRQALGAKSDFGHGEARLGLGKALYRTGRTEEALEALRRAAEDNASNLEGYFRLAQAAAKLGRRDESARAKAEFRRVARSLPRFAGKRRFRWRLALLLFPVTRHLL
jgi:tetratricopeptide (TPR) repeat protein